MEIIAKTADELFDKVIQHFECVKESDSESVYKEIVNAHLTLYDPTENTMINCKRNMPIRYAIGELLWYNSRNTSAESIYPFSKFWKKIADENDRVNSNYGYCIRDKYDFDQWNFIKELLRRDPDTRQAVIHIKEPRNLIISPTKDVNCTMTLQFVLRDNKLNLITNMRSNDVWLGLPYDVFNFTCMQIQMAMELDVNIGNYYHNVGSLHIYRKDVDKIFKEEI